MRVKELTIACLLIISLSFIIGCASMGGGQISGVNWALARNGGRITAFAEEPEHPVSTLINDVTSSE
ncbi:MAG: hypothetical protein AAB116_05115, partial [Candidatus Poribacteria bacterium]